MDYINNTFQNCTDPLEPGFDDYIFLGVIVVAVCAFSLSSAGVIYCFREEYASEFSEGEKHCFSQTISIIVYVSDVSTDVFLSMLYYKNGQFTYFYLTAAFSLAPVCITYIAICAFVIGKFSHIYKFYWCGLIFAVVVFGPIPAVFIHFIALTAGLGTGPDMSFPFEWKPVVHSLLEINFESLPQIVLQLYIKINTSTCDDENIHTEIFRNVTVAASVLSVVYVLHLYKSFIAKTQESTEDEMQIRIKWWKKILGFIKDTFLVITRIMIISLFVSKFTFWMYVFSVKILICLAFSFSKKINPNTIISNEEHGKSLIKRGVLTIIDACVNFFFVNRFIDYNLSSERNKKLEIVGKVLIVMENSGFYFSWFLSFYVENKNVWYFWVTFAVMIIYFIYWICFMCYKFFKWCRSQREQVSTTRQVDVAIVPGDNIHQIYNNYGRRNW